MKPRNRAVFTPRSPLLVGCLCVVGSLVGALLLLGAAPAHAAPVLAGDVDLLYELTPEDCVGCSASELQMLEDGLGLLLTRLRRESLNPYDQVCVAEASLVRDLAVLTFDLVRSQQITQNRWKDLLKAKATISGGTSRVTREELVHAFLDRVRDAAGAPLPDGTAGARQIEIHAAAQLARLFGHTATGAWDRADWLNALGSTAGGFHPVVDAVLAITGTGRQALDELIVDLEPQRVWLDGELWHLTHLPEDFALGTVPAQRDALRDEYRSALQGSFWTVMANGCGTEAEYGLRAYAAELSEGYQVVAVGKSEENPNPENNRFDDYQGEFGELIDVIANTPILDRVPAVLYPGGFLLPIFGVPGSPSSPTPSGPSSPTEGTENPEQPGRSNDAACILLSIFASGNAFGAPNPVGYVEELVIWAIATVTGVIAGGFTDLITTPLRLIPSVNQDYTAALGQGEFSTFPTVRTVIRELFGGWEEFQNFIRETCGG